MAGGGTEGDLLRERLNEAASGDAALRQLRRRHDALRADYEALLLRLQELEGRLEAEGAPPLEAAEQARRLDLAEQITTPLLRMRDDYMRTAEEIAQIIAGLEALASFDRPEEPLPAASRPRTVQLDVEAEDFGSILDMQERLSAMPGIARVSVRTGEAGKALLLVELAEGGNPPG
ncbi:MAG: hypothetical protein HYX53_07290 [Chloroflexi bacterium]|nr:hypothetical protein [Chloroflexota bacterium]